MIALTRRTLLTVVLALAFAASSQAQFSIQHSQGGTIPGLIKYVEPVYPREALIRGIGGRGKFWLKVNPKTGDVDEVKVVQSTGVTLLNEECAKAFFQWKFRPGSPDVVIPFEFHARGFSRVLH